MAWDPSYRPTLRPVEAFPLPESDGNVVALRDPARLSDAILSLSPAALRIVAMMDGSRSCEDIRRRCAVRWGQELPEATLHSLLDHLDRAYLLEGQAFESYYDSLLATYRRRSVRTMRDAAALGIDNDSARMFQEMLGDALENTLPGPVRGLVAPHLDYPRGRPAYASAYATLVGRDVPQRIVILGTNHFGRSTSVVATGKDFETPLGTSRTDVAFLEQLEARVGDLRVWELDHAREHSVELQVAWLQHIFGADSFTIAPLLCPDPCGPSGTAPRDGNGVDLRTFSIALGELVADDAADTLIVAGADLSHVGAQFGDTRQLDAEFLAEVRRRDEEALEAIVSNDTAKWLSRIAADSNPTRVCSAGCIFAMATALPLTTASILHYHQALDEPSQTCVTCCAIAFT